MGAPRVPPLNPSESIVLCIYIIYIYTYIDWKNISDQTYSCPRGWRLSASWGTIEGSPQTPEITEECGINGFQGGPQVSPPHPYMAADANIRSLGVYIPLYIYT